MLVENELFVLFGHKYRKMKKFSIQMLHCDRSIGMTAIFWSGPITADPTDEQFLGVKRRFGKFQLHI